MYSTLTTEPSCRFLPKPAMHIVFWVGVREAFCASAHVTKGMRIIDKRGIDVVLSEIARPRRKV